MLSSQRKEEILKSLYAAASDPNKHQAFTEYFDLVTTHGSGEDFKSWLEPHIEIATSIFEKLNFVGALEESADNIVSKLREPAAIVTVDGEIVASNARWNTKATIKNLAELSQHGEDRVRLKRVPKSLHTVLEDRTKVVRLENASTELGLLTFRRLPAIDERFANGGNILVRGIGFAWSDILKNFFLNEFAITDTELQVIQKIVDGSTLQSIAADLNRGRETIKTHTKNIYAKIDVAGREELVKLVLQLHALIGPNAAAPYEPYAQKQRSRFVELSNGHRIYCEEKGAQNGRRLLFVHGLSLGHHFSNDFEEQLARAGITLLCIERPGYGRSHPPENWKKGLEEWIDLFPQLMRKLQLSRSPIITQTGGVLLAAAAAAHHPHLVSGVCAFAAGVPITNKKKLGDYPPQIRVVSRAAWISPTVLRFIMTNGARYFRTPEGRERVIERTYAASHVDREALKNEEIRNNVRASLEMISDGGFDGFVSDNLHMFRDWSRFPKRAKCEIAYFNGTEDPICPIDWSQEFSETIPNMSVTPLKGAGNLMLHTHPTECVEHLKSTIARFDQ